MTQKRLFLIPCFLISFSFTLHADSTDWLGIFSTDWTTTSSIPPYSNWSNGIPGTGTPDLIAVFPFPGTETISLNSSVILNTLEFEAGSNYTISGSGTVNWGGGTQPATLTGPGTFGVPLNVANVFGSVATISGSVTSTSGVIIQPSMTLVSGGSVQLSFLQGSNSIIQVEGGSFGVSSTSIDSSSQIQVVGGSFESGTGYGSLSVDSSSVSVTGGEVILADYSNVNFQNHSTLSVASGTVTSASAFLRQFNFSDSTINQTGGNIDFNSDGTTLFTKANISLSGGEFIVNRTGGSFPLVFDNTSLSVTGGSLYLGSGFQLSTITFQNQSSINIQSGSVSFNGPLTFQNATGTISGADITVGGDVLIQNSQFMMNGGVLTMGPKLSLQINENSSWSLDGGSMSLDFLNIEGGTFNQSNGVLHVSGSGAGGNNNFTSSSLNISGGTVDFDLPIANNNFTSSFLNILGGAVNFKIANEGQNNFTSSSVNISGGVVNFSAPEGNSSNNFTSSSVNISGGIVNFSAPEDNSSNNFTSSFVSISGGTASFQGPSVLIGSIMDISTNISPSLFQSLSLQNSLVTISNNSSYSPNFPIHFSLDNSYAELPYFIVSNGDLDLLHSSISVDGSQVNKTGTYILFTANEISNYSIPLPQSTSSVVWNGPMLNSKDSAEQIVLTATRSSPPPLATLGSLAGGQPLTTAQRTEIIRDKVRSSEGNTASTPFASVKDSRNEYLAQNTFLAQQTPIELLGERAIQRPLNPWSVYFAPTGSFGSVKTKDGQLGNAFYTAGLMTGFDFASSYVHHPERKFAFGIGSTFYYTHLHATLDRHGGSTNINQIYANIYGTVIAKKLEELSLDFAVGGGYDWHDNKRTAGHFGSLTARGSTGGCEAGGFLGFEYLFSRARFPGMGNLRVIPLTYLQYVYISMNEYREHDAGEFNLKVHTDSLHSLRSFLGARGNYRFTAGKHVTIRPEVTLGWQREYLGDDQRVVFSNFLAPSPQSTSLLTIAPNRNTFIAGADLYVRMYDWTALLFNYQMSHNDLITDHSFYLEWKAEF